MAHADKQVRTPQGQAAIAPAREIAVGLPEVVEKLDGLNHITFRIRDKPFVIMGEDETGPWLAIKADRTSQTFLLKQGGFSKTPYIGQHGWVSVDDVGAADWKHLEQLIFDAYELIAPKRLVAEVRKSRE